jgi:hypothetical protein
MIEAMRRRLLAPVERVIKRQSAKRQLQKQIKAFLGESADWPLIQNGGRDHLSRMLVFCNSDWACSIEQHLLFAAIAECAGCKVFLAGTQLAEAYWKAMGFTDDRFVPWLNYKEKLRASAAREAQLLLSQYKTFDELKACQYKGVEVGKHVLSTVGRTHYRAYFDPLASDFYPAIRKHLESTIRKAMVMDKVMSEYGIDQVLMNEPNYSDVGVSQTATVKGKCYIQFCSPYEENAVIFKRYFHGSAVNPISLSRKVWSQLQAMPVTQQMETDIQHLLGDKYSGNNLFSKRIGLDAPKEERNVLIRKLNLDPARKTAVIFSNVLWDANMFWGSDLFPDGAEQWLVETVGLALKNPNLNWLVKVHPANVWKMRQAGVSIVYNDVVALKEKYGHLPDNIRLVLPEDNINPVSLFAVTDVGLTIRGTVGIELPLWGIPCVTAGTGRYSGHGFTIDPPDLASYEKVLMTLHHVSKLDQEAVDLAKRFFWGLFKGRAWRSGLFDCDYPCDDPSTHHIHLKSWSNHGDADVVLEDFLSRPCDEDYAYLSN